MSALFRPAAIALCFRRVRHRMPSRGGAVGAARRPFGVDAGTDVPPKVLVIEPDPRLRRAIAARLAGEMRVLTAGGGREGLACARREVPDLIVSAHAMPELDGLGLLAAVKGARGALAQTPVLLMVTRRDWKRWVGEALAAIPDGRADDYLLKPFGTADLMIRVRHLIRSREHAQRLATVTARLNMIMDNVPAGIVLLEPVASGPPDFMITAVNRNVNRVAGFTQQYLYAGGRLAECLRPAAQLGMYDVYDIDAMIKKRMEWYASRPTETIWSVFPTVGGRFVKATRSPYGDAGFVVVTVDTTEQVRTERALAEKSAHFDLMLENMPEGIFMCTADFTVVACNRHVNAVLGIAEGCVQVGRPLEASIRIAAEAGLYANDRSDGNAQVRRRMEWYASQPDQTISVIYPAVGGRFLRFTRSPLGPAGMVVVFMDITDQVRIETDLKVARDQAEAALENLLTTQNQLVQAEKMAALGRLVAGVAHEINTPIGIAVTVASLLSEQLDVLHTDLGDGRLRRSRLEQYLAGAREGCQLLTVNLHRAAGLVHSFKEVAADQASDECRWFELGGCLSDIVASLAPVWRKAGHRVEIVCPASIELEGYPGVIAQILTNFITNSVVHGFAPDTCGVLTITAALVGREAIEICYADNGRGIDDAVRDKVFDPFFTTRRGLGSTGLGLSIIYNLVVGKLGGSIDLESGEGRGVRFVLRFSRGFSPSSGGFD